MWIELNIVNTSNDDCLFSFVGKSEPTMFYCASSAVADRVSEGAVTDAGRRVHSTQDKLAAGVDDAVDLVSAVGALAVHKNGVFAAVADRCHHCFRQRDQK